MDGKDAVPTTVAAVDLGALAHNWALLRRRAGGRRVIAVIKANAYGHGALLAARCLARAGCDLFAVALLDEVGALRRGGIDAPVLLLGGVHGPAEARSALALSATPVVHAEREAAWLAEAARALGARARVHVEIDTGMRRLGVSPDDAPALLEKLAASPDLELEGLATHYARADESDSAPALAQLEVFSRVLAALAAKGVSPGLVHVANSAGLLAAQQWGDWALCGQAVRPGLALYGVAPAPHLADPELRPVMTLQSRVVAVRRVRAGDEVGYGASWRAPGSGWIASVPIGYADGIPWSAANRGELLIAGRRRPIAGRVSMDVTTAWLGEEVVAVGEAAVAFGTAPGGERLAVEEVARAAGTMPYELLVRVGARVPRVAVA
jgi:alanine racemase